MSKAAALSKNDPRFTLLQNRYNLTAELAAEKAALHFKNPQQYPLPAAGKKSLERAMFDFIKALPGRKQDKFLEKMQPAISASATTRKQKYGDLASVDLKQTKPVAEQVQAIPVEDKYKISADELQRFKEDYFPGKKLFPKKGAGKSAPQQAAVATKLDFFVDSVTCVKTNDVRKDEINLGAFATDAVGTESSKAPFFVSKFKKGESKGLGVNANLFTFAIDDGSVGAEFPLTFIAGVFLVEEDLISNVDLGRKLAALFMVLGLTLLVVGVGLLFVPGIGPSVALIAMYAAVGFNILGHYVFPAMLDDISEPAIDTLVLEAPPAIGDTFNRTLEFKLPLLDVNGLNKGAYTATARWVVS